MIASINKVKLKMNFLELRYRTKQQNYKTFDTTLARNFISTFNCTNKTDANTLDEELQGKTNQYNTDDLIQACFSCVAAACNTAFRIFEGRTLKTRRKMQWWNDELKILWKNVNALRQRYQRTLSNEDLRSERKVQHNAGKRQ